MNLRATIGLGALIFSATHVPDAWARSWPQTAGWDILERDSRQGCVMYRPSAEIGGTELVVFTFTDTDNVRILVSNSAWSAVKDAEYALDYVIDGKPYRSAISTGYEVSDGRKGFRRVFEPDFVNAIAAGKELRILTGETLVAKLSLSGSGAAIATVRRCTAALIDEEKAKKREKMNTVVADPFALPPRTLARAASPRGNPASWFTDDDYPAEARAAGQQGIVGYRLTVTEEGRVGSCMVTQSSGAEILDAATCSILARRATFTPALDSERNAIEGSYSSRVVWRY